MATKKQSKKTHSVHPRNKHEGRYDFKALVKAHPALEKHVRPNKYNTNSIDFSNAESVKALNTALVKLHYGIDHWIIPDGYLCPGVPGRADHIHHIADWLAENNFGTIPTGLGFNCLDIGVGSSLIYPIIGIAEYGWYFVATDSDQTALDSARDIVDQNPSLMNKVDFRFQAEAEDILYRAISREEKFDLAMCNPPFHGSAEEAQKSALRKVKNLTKGKASEAPLNFAGQPNELWAEGGERKFVLNYIRQSKNFANSCFWYTSLVSKQTNLRAFYDALDKRGATKVHTIPLGLGNKTSRILCWTFLSKEEQLKWKKERWTQK